MIRNKFIFYTLIQQIILQNKIITLKIEIYNIKGIAE